MTNPERLIEFNEVDAVAKHIIDLLIYMKYFDGEIAWKSSDNNYWYLASPIGGKPTPEALRDMTIEDRFYAFNNWVIMRIKVKPDINGEFDIDCYSLLMGGQLVATAHRVIIGSDDEDHVPPSAMANDSVMQFEVGLHTNDAEDYEAVNSAFLDLAEEVSQIRTERCRREVRLMSLAAELALLIRQDPGYSE